MRSKPTADDIRILGIGAVPRAFYEASKIVGLHAALFRPKHNGTPSGPSRHYQIAPRDSRAAEIALADARSILSEGLAAFGSRIAVKEVEDWTRDPVTGQLWPKEPWWKIDIRSTASIGDVKWTWEIGRHRDLVVLARAIALEPHNEEWSQGLSNLLALWMRANPLEASIHWYSNLEIALRLFAWDQILDLSGDALPPRLRAAMHAHIWQARRHLWRDLPYTLSSMKNNHMLGDALGLILAQSMTNRPHPSLGRRLADRVWLSQFDRQVRTDGSMVEDSLSYHRFVLEMFCVRFLQGDTSSELRTALRNTSEYLVNLGAMEGDIPQYGDWDEGRFLASSMSPHDVGNAAALGLALSGTPLDPQWIDRFDLLAWYGPARPEIARLQSSVRVQRAGDFSMARFGPWKVWLKSGSAPSHGHADLGHVSAQFDNHWVLTDPGTGTYNGPLEVRNGFRVSSAHNVLRPNGVGQVQPHRAFRWQSKPVGRAGVPLEFRDFSVLWGAHDAYLKVNTGAYQGRILRAVVVSTTGLVVIDWREDGCEGEYAISLPLDPNIDVRSSSLLTGGVEIPVRLPGVTRIVRGEVEPFLGWHSSTYGQWAPCNWLLAEGRQSGPIWWSVGVDEEPHIDGETVFVRNATLTVKWRSSCALLSVSASGFSKKGTVEL